MRGICFLLFLTFFLTRPVSFSAEIYRWTDEKGTVHFTDDSSKIPQNDSTQTEKIQAPDEKARDVQRPPKPDDRSDRVNAYLKEIDKKIEAKKKLEVRISQLETESRSIEERLKWIEEYEKQDFQYYQPFRDPKTGKWVKVASPYYDEKRRLEHRRDSINKEVPPSKKNCQRSIEAFRRRPALTRGHIPP